MISIVRFYAINTLWNKLYFSLFLYDVFSFKEISLDVLDLLFFVMGLVASCVPKPFQNGLISLFFNLTFYFMLDFNGVLDSYLLLFQLTMSLFSVFLFLSFSIFNCIICIASSNFNCNFMLLLVLQLNILNPYDQSFAEVSQSSTS